MKKTLLSVLVFALAAVGAWAQECKSTQAKPGWVKLLLSLRSSFNVSNTQNLDNGHVLWYYNDSRSYFYVIAIYENDNSEAFLAALRKQTAIEYADIYSAKMAAGKSSYQVEMEYNASMKRERYVVQLNEYEVDCSNGFTYTYFQGKVVPYKIEEDDYDEEEDESTILYDLIEKSARQKFVWNKNNEGKAK